MRHKMNSTILCFNFEVFMEASTSNNSGSGFIEVGTYLKIDQDSLKMEINEEGSLDSRTLHSALKLLNQEDNIDVFLKKNNFSDIQKLHHFVEKDLEEAKQSKLKK